MSDDEALPCADKLAFDTKQKAQAEATATAWRRGVKVYAYKCRYCSLWHLSSQVND